MMILKNKTLSVIVELVDKSPKKTEVSDVYQAIYWELLPLYTQFKFYSMD